MASDDVYRAKRRTQYLSPPSPSIRIRAALVLVCASERDGQACCEMARFEHDEPEGAIGLARKAGWDFRLRAARCPACGRAGASFGKVES